MITPTPNLIKLISLFPLAAKHRPDTPHLITHVLCYRTRNGFYTRPVCPVCSALLGQEDSCPSCAAPLDRSKLDRALIILCEE